MFTRGLAPFFAFLFAGHPTFGHPELGKDPSHRAVGALPLVFVDGARQEALNVGTLRRNATTDHFGNGSGYDNGWQRRIKHFPCPFHRLFGALAHFLFGQSCHHNWQFMRRQSIGVMQHGCHRQVFTSNRAVDHDLQAFDSAEGINSPPVAASPIMILNKH